MKTISLLFIISLFTNGVFGDEVSVMEGDSVTLHTDTEIQALNDVTIIWKLNYGAQKIKIAQINNANKISVYADVLDGKFKDRLQLNDQTGDLTITDIRTTDSGLYIVDIHVGSKETQKNFDIKGVINPELDQLKSVSVKDGDSVTLQTDAYYMKKYDEILWMFQGIRIAQFNKSASKIPEDKRFQDKLQPDVQTGSLKIKKIRTDLSGLYEVNITSRSSGYTIHQSFAVTVRGEVKPVSVIKGDAVTIFTDVPDIKTYDQILLVFGCDDKIAEVNKQNKQFTLYGRIRDRLKLNDQTRDLTITDIRNEDAGDYELKMSSRRRTIQRRFSVSVSERGLSPGAKAGISVFFILLAAALAAGVIYYRRKIAEEREKQEKLDVYVGESVRMKTEVTDIQRDDVIEWTFGDEETLIAKINPADNIFSTYDCNYDLFRGKLKLNHQTGDLTINNSREEHTGVYKLTIIRGGKPSDRRLFVSVRYKTEELQVYERKSADLKTEVKDIKKDDVIEWRFGDNETLIAKINPANNIFRTYNGDYDLFKDKLKLNPQTGDLNINDITWKHEGNYLLKIIRDGKTSYKRFSVFVKCTELNVNKRNVVVLKTEVTNVQEVDVIEWRFGETRIAEINPANKIFSTYDGDDGEFRDKLKLNDETGDLMINNIREEHAGVYTLRIIRGGKPSDKRFRVFVRAVRVNVKVLQVNEEDSEDLKTEVKDIKTVDVMEWRFGRKETLIAKINPANNIFSTYDGDNDLFRDKLTLNPQTGDLNIKNITWEHGGVYTLKIIRGGKTSYRRFSVSVGYTTLEVNKGSSVDLKTKLTDIQRFEKIEWRFKGALIAQINPADNIFNTYNVDTDLFRDKLELNRQTGDLKINDIREEHDGEYILLFIRGRYTSDKRFNVSVSAGGDSVRRRGGDSVGKRGEDSVGIVMPLLNNSS